MPGAQDLPGDHSINIAIPGQATAGTDDEWPLMIATAKIVVTGVKWTPKSNVTADDTNNYALQVLNRGAAGAGTGAVTTVRTMNVAAGNEVKNTPEAFTVGAAPTAVAGDVLALVRTHNGTGLAMPQGSLQVTYRYR